MACSVELLAEVDREIDKVDAQHSKRILKFLHARVAKLDDLRSIGEALHGSGLGSSGNIVWAITGSSGRSKTIVWWFCSSASEIAKKVIVSALQMDDLVHLDALSFSIHFPIKGSFKSAKCRRSSALDLTSRTLPRFRCRFDSDRPLHSSLLRPLLLLERARIKRTAILPW